MVYGLVKREKKWRLRIISYYRTINVEYYNMITRIYIYPHNIFTEFRFESDCRLKIKKKTYVKGLRVIAKKKKNSIKALPYELYDLVCGSS